MGYLFWLVDENKGTAVPPNTAILKAINREGVEFLTEECGGNL